MFSSHFLHFPSLPTGLWALRKHTGSKFGSRVVPIIVCHNPPAEVGSHGCQQDSPTRSRHREFNRLTNANPPIDPTKEFKPIRLNLSRLDGSWDRCRGAALRMMSVLLCEDDATLEQRVCEDSKSAKTYADAADWMQKETAWFKRMAHLLETAGTRVGAVVQRCGQSAPQR